MRITLKWKIILPVCLSTLLCFAAVAVVAATQIRTNNLQNAEHDLSSSADILAGVMETYLEGGSKQADLVASLPLTQKVMAQAFQQDFSKKDAVRMLESNPDFLTLRDLLKSACDTYGYNAIHLINKDGTVAVSQDMAMIGKNFADREYFKALKGATGTYFSDVIISKTTGKLTLVCVKPLFDGQKQLIGALLVSMAYYDYFMKTLANAELSGKGYPYILSSNGRIIAHPKESVMSVEKPSPLPFIPDMYNQKNGSFYYTYLEKEKLGVMHEMPMIGWVCVASVNVDAFLVTADHITMVIVVAAVASCIFIALVIFLIASVTVDKPMTAIRVHLLRFAAGEMDILEEWKAYVLNKILPRRDEIGDIGRAIEKLRVYVVAKVEVADRIAQRDLTVRVDLAGERDRFGLALTQMVENLNDAFGQVRDAVDEVNNGSLQVSSAAQALSQGATEQASSLQEITATVQTMGAQAGHNAENATQAKQLTQTANDAARSGREQMRTLSQSILDITRKAEAIVKINKVIDDIAFQTNLLALNAAVEAARAGRHGKGFAVVAEEVRNLAARSAKAAAETRTMIEEVVQQIQSGNALAGQTAEHLEGIGTQVGRVNDLVAEIAAASSEQAQGVMQTSQALLQIDKVTQQNTASAEETASASEQMALLARNLHDLVATYRVTVAAGQSPARSRTLSAPQEQAALPYSGSDADWGEKS